MTHTVWQCAQCDECRTDTGEPVNRVFIAWPNKQQIQLCLHAQCEQAALRKIEGQSP